MTESLLSFSSHDEREGEARRALLAEGATQAPVIVYSIFTIS